MPRSYTKSVGSPSQELTYKGNGGTHIEMENLVAVVSTTSASNDTLTITADIYINNWGTKDVTMALPIDDIVTIS